MAAFEDELRTLLENINRNSRFGGQIVRGGNEAKAFGAATSGMNKAAGKVTESLRVLHGSTDDLAYSFKKMLSYVAGGEVISFLLDTGRNLVRTYNTLSDVGQTFGGSLAEMAKQQGDAGQSLDEYAKSITKNSALAAVMNVHYGDTGQTLIQMQKGMRGTLKEFGYYGMTLSESTDTINDFLDVFRQSGGLFRTSAESQKTAITSLVGDVTALATLTGKSRQEILKNTKDTMTETGALGAIAQMGTKNGTEALTKWTTMLGTMAPELSTILNKGIVAGSVYLTQEGKEMADAGLTDNLAMLEQIRQKVAAGIVPTLEEMGKAGNLYKDMQGKHIKSLQSISGIDPSVTKFITMWSKWNGMDFEKAAQIQKEEEENFKKHPWTRFALTFESVFHDIIGQFQKGFYDSLIKGLAPSQNEEEYNKNIEAAKADMLAIGSFIGRMMVDIKPAFDTVLSVFEWIATKLEALRDFMTGAGIGKGWATLIVAAIPYAVYKIAKGFLSLAFQKAVIRVGSAVFGGKDASVHEYDRSHPAPSDEFDRYTEGTGKPTKGQRARRYAGYIGGGVGMIGGLIAGEIVDRAINPIIDSLMGQDDSTLKGFVEAALDIGITAGGTALGALGGKIAGNIASGIAARVAAGAAEATLAEAGGTGILAAAGGVGLVAAGAAILGFVTLGLIGAVAAYYSSKKSAETTEQARQEGNDRVVTVDDMGNPTSFGNTRTNKVTPGIDMDHPNDDLASRAQANPSIVPLPPRLPFTQMGDIEAMKKRMEEDKARVADEEEKRKGSTPDANTAWLKDISTTLAEMKDLNACLTALAKKNNDLTADGNRQQSNFGECK